MVVMDQLCIDVDERDSFGSCFVDPEQRAPFDVERICCHSDFSHLILFLPAALFQQRFYPSKDFIPSHFVP